MVENGEYFPVCLIVNVPFLLIFTVGKTQRNIIKNVSYSIHHLYVFVKGFGLK